MSEAAYAQKLYEEERLRLFLVAYEEVTGITLSVKGSGERPDFVGAFPDSSLVGLELTRPSHNYEMRCSDRMWSETTMGHYDLLCAVHEIVATKAKKIKEPDWRTEKTILLVFLEDYTFDSFAWIEDAGVESDFAEYGFAEIWLADCSTIEPFGAVRLIGLHPQGYWGLGKQPSLAGKPFG